MKKRNSLPLLVPDPVFLEQAVQLLARKGNREMLDTMAAEVRRLADGRTHLEKRFSDLAIGRNYAILQLSAVLAKTGFEA